MGRQDDEQSSYSQSLLAAGSRQNQGSVSLCRPETRLGKPCFRTCVSDESAVVTEFIEDSPELLDVPDELSTPKLPEKDGFGLGFNDEAGSFPGRSVHHAMVMGQEVLVPTEAGFWAPKSLANRESSFDHGFCTLSEKDERDALHICELISAFAGQPMSEGQDEWDWLLMAFRRRFACMQPICKSAALEVLQKPVLGARHAWRCDGSSGSMACNEGSQLGMWSFESKCAGPGVQTIIKSDFNCSDFISADLHEDGFAELIPSSMQPSFLTGGGMVDKIDSGETDHINLKVDMKEFYKAVGQSLATKSTKSGSTCAESPGGPSSSDSSCCLSRAPTAPSTEGRSALPPFKGDSASSSSEKALAASESRQPEEPLCELHQESSLLPGESSCVNPFEDPGVADNITTAVQETQSPASSASFARGQVHGQIRSGCGCFVGLRKKLTGSARSAGSKGASAPPSNLASAPGRESAATLAGHSCNAKTNSPETALPRPDCVSQLGPQAQRPTVTSC